MSGRLPVSFLLLHFWPFLKCPHRQKGKTGKKLHYLTVFWQFWEEAQRVEIEMKALRVFLDHLQVLFHLCYQGIDSCTLSFIASLRGGIAQVCWFPFLTSKIQGENVNAPGGGFFWRCIIRFMFPPRTPLRKGFSSSLLGGGQTMGRGQLGL